MPMPEEEHCPVRIYNLIQSSTTYDGRSCEGK